jgi:hypothetical protein
MHVPARSGAESRQWFMATWTCDFCGATGETPESATADQVLCHACAEPVVPDDPSGRVRLGE